MFNSIIDTIKAGYQKLWDWSYNAGSIVLARITAIFGFLTSALSFADWSPLLSMTGIETGISHIQAFWIGAVIFVKGVIDEIVRRNNTVVTESSKLIPAQITVPEVKAAKKQNK